MRRDDFERLYEEHAQPLFGFLAYRTGDQALAEDLLADTFERALKARKRFDRRKASEKTWLYAIALNLLRDNARRSRTEARALERLPHETGGGPPDQLAAVEHRDQVQRALTILSDEEREAIALRFGGDLTVPEIAKLLKQPLPRVEGRVYRSLRKLRDELD
ncbi:MAG: RNA polymerase sigma factor [Gaiellaceae bacterium]